MNKRMFFVSPIICLFFLFFTLLSCTPSEEDDSIQFHEDYILIDQNSDSYSNGFLHGSAAKSIIKEQVETWQKQMFSDLGLSLDQMEEIVYKKTGFLIAIEKYTPQLIQEINGIADGAELDRGLILCYNLGEEIYNYQNRSTERCSNLAVSSKGKHILTYNQDLPFFLHGNNRPIILRSNDAIVFALPGMLALSGVSKTVAVTCNSLPMLQMNTNGLPLSFAIRQILKQTSLSNTLDYLQDIPLAIPQNFLLAAPEGIVGIEVSENILEVYKADDLPYLYHTNFPVYNNDHKYEAYEPPVCTRYQAVETFLHKTDALDYNEKTLTKSFGEKPLNNEETYLRFTVSFQSNQSTNPILQFINPKQSNTRTFLPFKN
ncbi:MAG: hypothetical protein Sapg2KO_04110 [Saprospiraceae bacterium]